MLATAGFTRFGIHAILQRMAGGDGTRRQLPPYNPFLMALGVVCMLAAIVGGGIKVAGQEFPVIESVGRAVLLFALGAVLVGASFFLRSDKGDSRITTDNGGPTADNQSPDVGRIAQSYDQTTVTESTATLEPLQQKTPESIAKTPLTADTWQRSLLTGSVETELNTASATEMDTFSSLVSDVLGKKRFRPETISRTNIILRELLRNVADHAPDSTAWVMIGLQEEYLRLVSIAVYDSGSQVQLNPWDQMQRFVDGEREHGLMRTFRMASVLHIYRDPPGVPPGKRNGIWCDVYEPRKRSSIFSKYKDIALVRVEYRSPNVFWLGKEAYVDQYRRGGEEVFPTFIHTLTEAWNKRPSWRPILELYFEDLVGKKYLALEVTGTDLVTEPSPGALVWLQRALEMYLDSYFTDGRVIALAHDTRAPVPRKVSEWASERGIEYFNSESACRARLDRLSDLAQD